MAKILIGRTLDSSTDSVTTEQGPASTPWLVAEQTGLVPEEYDYVDLGYTGALLTSVVFKTGGAGGTTVATLSLTYDANDNLDTVTRT